MRAPFSLLLSFISLSLGIACLPGADDGLGALDSRDVQILEEQDQAETMRLHSDDPPILPELHFSPGRDVGEAHHMDIGAPRDDLAEVEEEARTLWSQVGPGSGDGTPESATCVTCDYFQSICHDGQTGTCWNAVTRRCQPVICIGAD